MLAPASGEVPVVPRPPVADLAGGVYAALAVCAALVRRGRTGEGETVDVSMADLMASWTGAAPPLTLDDGRALGGRVPGYGTFPTADGGWIALGVLSEDHLWAALTEALGLGDLGRLSFTERLALVDRLDEQMGDAVAARDRDELVAALVAARVPAAPVLSQPEMLAAEHFRQRGTVGPGADGAPVVHHPVRYERHPTSSPRDVPPLVEGPERLPRWRAAPA